MSVKQKCDSTNNPDSEGCEKERKLFTDPSLSPPERRNVDGRAHSSEATWKTSTGDWMNYQKTP